MKKSQLMLIQSTKLKWNFLYNTSFLERQTGLFRRFRKSIALNEVCMILNSKNGNKRTGDFSSVVESLVRKEAVPLSSASFILKNGKVG